MAEANVKPKKKPFFARMKKYFKDTKSELKKNTIVILVFIIIVGIFLFAFDMLFAWLSSLLTNIV